MSIIRVGLSETKNYSEGWDAIFGKKNPAKSRKAEVGTESGKTKKKRPARKKK